MNSDYLLDVSSVYSLFYKFISVISFIPDKVCTNPLTLQMRKPRGKVVKELVLGHTFSKR